MKRCRYIYKRRTLTIEDDGELRATFEHAPPEIANHITDEKLPNPTVDS